MCCTQLNGTELSDVKHHHKDSLKLREARQLLALCYSTLPEYTLFPFADSGLSRSRDETTESRRSVLQNMGVRQMVQPYMFALILTA